MPDSDAVLILAFDYGLKRIGIATGDTVTRTASPRAALPVGAAGPDWPGIEREIRTVRPALLVVGTPYNADGSPGTLTRAAREFAAELENRFGLPVKRVDERWSSLEAAATLRGRRASGARRRLQRGEVDSASAAVILERWLGGEEERK